MKVKIDPALLGGHSIIIRHMVKGVDCPLAAIDPDDSPIEVCGAPWHQKGRLFCRIPEEELQGTDVNSGVITSGAFNSAGIILRFKTNSNIVGIRALLSYNNDTKRMLQEGKNGFAFYSGTGKDKVLRYLVPPPDERETYFTFAAGDMGAGEQETEWTIYCPLVTAIHYIRVLVSHEAEIASPTPFAVEKPVLFYGSSVTNGIAASNPANVYTALLGRWLDVNIYNWGFNGSCKGEADLAKLIGRMDLAAFFMCFDNNAPNAQFIQERHKPFFDLVRKAQPKLPIVIVSRPEVHTDIAVYEDGARKRAVRSTYEQALASGDENVYFIDGETLVDVNQKEASTVDGCHPNDFAFYHIAKGIRPTLEMVLKKYGYLK